MKLQFKGGMSSMNVQHVFGEGKIGHISLQNRIVMPGMSTILASSKREITDGQIRYYEERAKGGVGLIITEFTTIEYELGKGAVNQLRIDKDGFVPGIHRLANA